MIVIQGKRYQLASRGDRFIGQFIDGLIYVGFFFLGLFICDYFRWENGELIGFAVALYYLVFQDGFKNGQSYGKRIVNTKVVHEATGNPCSFLRSFIRNIILPFLGWIDWLFIFGGKRKRLGDILASTVVVYDTYIDD